MNIKVARILKNLTQSQLREKLREEYSIGISPCTIVAIEKGDFSNLKYDTMVAISKILDKTVQELFFDEK